jgi:hypothetical protein
LAPRRRRPAHQEELLLMALGADQERLLLDVITITVTEYAVTVLTKNEKAAYREG